MSPYVASGTFSNAADEDRAGGKNGSRRVYSTGEDQRIDIFLLYIVAPPCLYTEHVMSLDIITNRHRRPINIGPGVQPTGKRRTRIATPLPPRLPSLTECGRIAD
jgi:hypothetical protein